MAPLAGSTKQSGSGTEKRIESLRDAMAKERAKRQALAESLNTNGVMWGSSKAEPLRSTHRSARERALPKETPAPASDIGGSLMSSNDHDENVNNDNNTNSRIEKAHKLGEEGKEEPEKVEGATGTNESESEHLAHKRFVQAVKAFRGEVASWEEKVETEAQTLATSTVGNQQPSSSYFDRLKQHRSLEPSRPVVSELAFPLAKVTIPVKGKKNPFSLHPLLPLFLLSIELTFSPRAPLEAGRETHGRGWGGKGQELSVVKCYKVHVMIDFIVVGARLRCLTSRGARSSPSQWAPPSTSMRTPLQAS